MRRCTEKTLEQGKKRLHRWNKAGVCIDCGDVSHRAVRIKRLTAEWTCPNCRSDIEWTEQIVDQQKRDPRPGDSFICVECSTVSVVTPENRLRPMTEEKSTLGGGWSIEVRRAGFPLGHIRRDTSGTYLYFNGMANTLSAMLSDDDLGKLKGQVVARL